MPENRSFVSYTTAGLIRHKKELKQSFFHNIIVMRFDLWVKKQNGRWYNE